MVVLAFSAGVSLTIAFFIKKISKNIIKPLKIIDESFNKIHRGNYIINFPKFNITEIDNIANNLEKLTLELKENANQHYQFEQSKKELIAKITHDLKTPLTSIKGYIEALEDNINNDESTYFRYLEIINEKSDKLNLLIDDLLLFSQLDLDNFTYDKKQVDSKEFIENFASSKQLEFKDTTIDFILRRPIIATNIYIDPKRILQVFENIVSNAKKFTRNYIAISTTINASYLIINFEDNGIGIDLKHQPHIFELFYKTDDSRSEPSQAGSGLGLNISKQIIEAHGGKITLESEPNKKTVFSINIPLSV
jgi:signal transduction histidine kinase